MQAYNISYGYQILNKKPLSKKQVEAILSQPYINKKIGNDIIKIPTKHLSVNKYIIVI